MTIEPKAKVLTSRPLVSFFAQAGFGTAFAYLTSGIFLSGLALLMGASDVLVSYLSFIVNICGVLILAFSPFLERVHSRKRLTIVLTVMSRLATLLIVAIPVLVPQQLRLPLFVTVLVVAFTLQAQTTVVLNQWMLGFIDERKSGRYVSLRQTMTLVVTVVLSVLGGWLMDMMNGDYRGFVVLFTVAGLMGTAEVLLLLRTPDSKACRQVVRRGNRWDMLRLPLCNRQFLGFVLYIFTFYLLLNIADAFTMVYLMKYLALPYRTVTALYMIISLPQVVLLGVWGKISDQRGHTFVLKASIWLFVGETFFMVFAAPTVWYLFVPLAFLFAAVANAGFVVAVFNRRYELMPPDNRIVYDNFYTAVIGLGFVRGPLIGGVLRGWLEQCTSTLHAVPFAGIRLLYLLSTVGILLLQLTAHIWGKVRSQRYG